MSKTWADTDTLHYQLLVGVIRTSSHCALFSRGGEKTGSTPKISPRKRTCIGSRTPRKIDDLPEAGPNGMRLGPSMTFRQPEYEMTEDLEKKKKNRIAPSATRALIGERLLRDTVMMEEMHRSAEERQTHEKPRLCLTLAGASPLHRKNNKQTQKAGASCVLRWRGLRCFRSYVLRWRGHRCFRNRCCLPLRPRRVAFASRPQLARTAGMKQRSSFPAKFCTINEHVASLSEVGNIPTMLLHTNVILAL